MITASEMKTPRLVTAVPGPRAKQIVERDARFMSPSFTRDYPLVAKSGHGAMVEDVDGNVVLDFAAGISVLSAGQCHSKDMVVKQKKADYKSHISLTEFFFSSVLVLCGPGGGSVAC